MNLRHHSRLSARIHNLFDPMLIQIITPKMAIQSSINPIIPKPTLSMLCWAKENARTGSMKSLFPAHLFSLLASLTSQWGLLARISELPAKRTTKAMNDKNTPWNTRI